MSQTVKERYAEIAQSATIAEIMQAATWYAGAHDIARSLSADTGHSIDKTASVISAFSPRVHWHRNIQLATDFLHGRDVATLGASIRNANRALTMGFDALKGLKTNAFARNIAGDLNAVTIDTWMIQAAGMSGTKGINKTQYGILSDAITELASEYGVSPAQLQALVWIVSRGRAH